MTQNLRDAAERVSHVLDQENAALVALDFNRVGAFAAEKRLAIEALQSFGVVDATSSACRDEPGLHVVALRLQSLVGENKRLLERAITVQTRIMGVIASAARATQAPPGYGGQGRLRSSSSASATALLLRA